MLSDYLNEVAIKEVMSGDRSGCHNSAHWFKVSQLGTLIALAEGVDPVVPLLFGFYHDCRRENDGFDPNHGHRAALLALNHSHRGLLNISQDQLTLLMFACEHHTKGSVDSEDKVVSACWDADRLDLPRVGVQTLPEFLGTDTAKSLCEHQKDMYSYAYRDGAEVYGRP